MTPIRFYGTPKSAIEKGIRKTFSNLEVPVAAKLTDISCGNLYFERSGKLSPQSVKFQAMKWIRIFGFAKEERDLKASRLVEVVRCLGWKIASNIFAHSSLLMDPPWSSLIIGDSLSLNGSPGLWPEKMQKCGDHTALCHTVVEMVGDHCRPSYGHHQSKKLVKYKIKPQKLFLKSNHECGQINVKNKTRN